MKKIILAVSLAAVIIISGCTTTVTNTPSAGAPAKSKITAAETATPTAAPSVSVTPLATPAQSFTIPRETKVFATPEELAPIKPLFKDYILEDDLFAFAVSTVFEDEAYLMGFLYENSERTLPFSRVIGLKDNGGKLEEAFISDNYKPDPDGCMPENLYWNEMFYDTQVFEIGGMLVVKTYECLSEDAGFHNFFLFDEEGLLDNHINTNLNESCELFEYKDKLLLNECYTWYEFTVKDKKIVLNEITEYGHYKPKTDKSDFIITLKDFKPGTYDEGTHEYNDDSYFKADIDGSVVLTKENFNMEEEESGYVYFSKKTFKIDVGTSIILLYPSGMEIDCHISGEMDDSAFEHSSLPGAEVLRAQEPGEYIGQVENGNAYLIYITVE